MEQPFQAPYSTPVQAPYAAPMQEPYAVPGQAPCSAYVSVVGPQFCTPYPADLAIMKKVLTINDGNFSVIDINGNIVFTLKGKNFTLHDRRVLLDGAGTPIVTLTKKIRTMHDRWHVFRGESTDSNDILFTVKRSSGIQIQTNLEVFLATNTKEEVCDFQIKGSWLERSCIVYAGESSTIVAQMHKEHTIQSIILGKEKFMVTIYPNIDHAFIVSLIVILNEINKDDDDD
ncbi:hypothetical protein ACOSQ2_029448 [Xanthoceras sorbifolium]